MWTGIWEHDVARLRLGRSGCVEWSAPASIACRVSESLPVYHALDRDWEATAAGMPIEGDPHLTRCVREFPGLRLLSQPFGVAEEFTGMKGRYVTIAETIKGFKEIVEGKHDSLLEQAFYMVGPIDEVIKAARELS